MNEYKAKWMQRRERGEEANWYEEMYLPFFRGLCSSLVALDGSVTGPFDDGSCLLKLYLRPASKRAGVPDAAILFAPQGRGFGVVNYMAKIAGGDVVGPRRVPPTADELADELKGLSEAFSKLSSERMDNSMRKKLQNAAERRSNEQQGNQFDFWDTEGF